MRYQQKFFIRAIFNIEHFWCTCDEGRKKLVSHRFRVWCLSQDNKKKTKRRPDGMFIRFIAHHSNVHRVSSLLTCRCIRVSLYGFSCDAHSFSHFSHALFGEKLFRIYFPSVNNYAAKCFSGFSIQFHFHLAGILPWMLAFYYHGNLYIFSVLSILGSMSAAFFWLVFFHRFIVPFALCNASLLKCELILPAFSTVIVRKQKCPQWLDMFFFTLCAHTYGLERKT